QAEDGIRDFHVTGVQTCALPIFPWSYRRGPHGEDVCFGRRRPVRTAVRRRPGGHDGDPPRSSAAAARAGAAAVSSGSTYSIFVLTTRRISAASQTMVSARIV